MTLHTLIDELPAEFLPFKANILASAKPVINIALRVADGLPLWASKIGGNQPYLPKNMDYPTDKDGRPLGFLAQFNLADLPANDHLPKTGMLVFFTNFDDGKVLYFDEVIQDDTALWTDFEGLGIDTDELPFFDEVAFAPTFTLTESAISFTESKAFDVIFANHTLSEQELDELSDKIYDLPIFDSTGHHLLGYPYFTQSDPRAYQDGDVPQDYVLLFQLDTDDVDGYEIMWGDSGVGNFFIHPDDLAKGDFSRVKFYWDCC